MLLSNDPVELDSVAYDNMYASYKRDGVRAEISCAGIVGRSLKPFRNTRVNEAFKATLDTVRDLVVEVEIYSRTTPCRELAGILNSTNKPLPDDVELCAFGLVDLNLSFLERFFVLNESGVLGISLVDQKQVCSKEEAVSFYEGAIAEGYEGAVLMEGTAKYKQGRVTIKQGIGYKLKPEREDDLEIVGVTERMENTNASQTNELGLAYKRNTKDAKKGTGVGATLLCLLPNGGTCGVNINGTEEFRRQVWADRELYVGKYAVVKSMAYGTKKSLRHPRLIKIKEGCEK